MSGALSLEGLPDSAAIVLMEEGERKRNNVPKTVTTAAGAMINVSSSRRRLKKLPLFICSKVKRGISGQTSPAQCLFPRRSSAQTKARQTAVDTSTQGSTAEEVRQDHVIEKNADVRFPSCLRGLF